MNAAPASSINSKPWALLAAADCSSASAAALNLAACQVRTSARLLGDSGASLEISSWRVRSTSPAS